MPEISIEALTLEDIRKAGRIFVDDSSGPVQVRESPKMAPFVSAQSLGTTSPADLVVLVTAGTANPSQTVLDAIRRLASA